MFYLLHETLGECLKEGNCGNAPVHTGRMHVLAETGLKGNKHIYVETSAFLYKRK